MPGTSSQTRMRAAAGIASLLILHASSVKPLHSQQMLTGVVRDSASEPVSHGVVTIFRDDASRTAVANVLTAPSGRFGVEGLGAGHYLLVVRRMGYRPDTTRLFIDSVQSTRTAANIVVSTLAAPLTAFVVRAPRCTRVDALASDSLTNAYWALVEASVASRAALFRSYSFRTTIVDSSFTRGRPHEWQVSRSTAEFSPKSSAFAGFQERLYSVTRKGKDFSVQTGSEFGVLSADFRERHCLSLAINAHSGEIDGLTLESLAPDASGFSVRGMLRIDHQTNQLREFSYDVYLNERKVLRAFYLYDEVMLEEIGFPVVRRFGVIQYGRANDEIIGQASVTRQFQNFQPYRIP